MEKKKRKPASTTSRGSKARARSPLLRLHPRLIQSFLDGHEWSGTVTKLARALGQLGNFPAPCAAHLAIWLRRHEPTLWWSYGVRVRFSRTSEDRTVHFS